MYQARDTGISTRFDSPSDVNAAILLAFPKLENLRLGTAESQALTDSLATLVTSRIAPSRAGESRRKTRRVSIWLYRVSQTLL
jgi:hypothetical protein